MNRTLVRVAEIGIGDAGELLVAVGLGSCVAILLHDPVAGVGGLAHVLLPEPRREGHSGSPAKFASTAVPHLVKEMAARGASPDRLVARLVGGASMFAALLTSGTLHTGARNIAAARAALEEAGIPLLGEDVGLEHGRTVHFHPEDGRTVITSARKDDVLL